MRTTLVLDDAVVREARHRAVDAGLTLSEFVNRALRAELLSDEPANEPRFSFPVYGGPGLVDHAPHELWAASENDDLHSLARG